MNNDIKEILEALKPQDEEFIKAGIKEYPLYLRPDQQRILLDYITNLQTIEQQYSAILSENAELENKITNLQEEYEKTNIQVNYFMNRSDDLEEIIDDYKSRIDKANEVLKDTSVDMPETLLIETIDYARHTLNGDDNN